jgi:uncharacterized protein (TIGR02285 family)
LNRMIACLLFVSTCFVAQAGRSADAEVDITWYTPDYPPSFILTGPNKGKGIVDVFWKGVMERLPEYRHHIVTANMKRIIWALESQRKACAASLFITPERRKFVAFSEPYMFVFPVGVLFLKARYGTFEKLANEKGQLSLQELLNDSGLRLGYSNGRSYHKQVDRIIGELASLENSSKISTNSISYGVVRLLLHRRFDYAVGFSFEAEWLEREYELGDVLEFMPIAEAREVQLNHFGCPDNEWGRRVIADINRVVRQIRTDPRFYDTYLSWVSPYEKQRYLELLNEGFPPLVSEDIPK